MEGDSKRLFQLPESTILFMLASLIHHEQYLRHALCPQHPIFKARVFSANRLLQVQRGATILVIGTSPVCGLKATGIPAHLATVKQVNDLRDHVASLHSDIDDLKTGIAQKLPNEVAMKVYSELRQHFCDEWCRSRSLRDLERRIDDLRANMAAEFRSIFSAN